MELEGAMGVQSTDVSSCLEKKRKIDGSSSSSSSSPPYEALISLPIRMKGMMEITERWYTMKIPADAVDGAEGSISEAWRTWAPHENSTFALLGSDLYSIGGRSYDSDGMPFFISKVHKVNIRDPIGGWIPVESMISPRANPHIFVIGGKLYALSGEPSGVPPPNAPVGEVYDPMTDSWKALPVPPCYMGVHMLCAALENPNRILVASLSEFPDDEDHEPVFDDSFANFCIYQVQNCSWKMLCPTRRDLVAKCPLGYKGKAVAVGNCLYWITYHRELLAYDFVLDLWLTGWIEGLSIPVIRFYQPAIPCLLHLKDERFCIIKCTTVRYPRDDYIECILFDVSPVPEKRILRISAVSRIKYRTTDPTVPESSFLMGK
ncbi:uncharacterized protein LOC132162138 isoform X2 [Corylus avellana]|uniref:uncharacterized protein LOC132162138 isoform X2 n=1 Tax=Corylus avellana TaxID=13451 RepID=UPI00286BD3FF|nr:uncharacterized protein LOC132162138 isoform X2 [Corylus avellana]